MSAQTEIKANQIIQIIKTWLIEYADCRDEMDALKTAKIIYNLCREAALSTQRGGGKMKSWTQAMADAILPEKKKRTE